MSGVGDRDHGPHGIRDPVHGCTLSSGNTDRRADAARLAVLNGTRTPDVTPWPRRGRLQAVSKLDPRFRGDERDEKLLVVYF